MPLARMAVISLSAASRLRPKNSDEHARGNADVQSYGNNKKEYLSHAGQRRAVADDQFEDLSEIAGEKNKGEDGDADQGMSRDFAKDVAGQNPHGRRLSRV